MKRYAPAAVRNRDPILEVLRRVLPESGLVLEVASGTGEHVIHFAASLPSLAWQPSDIDAGNRDSIADWTRTAGLTNVRPPIIVDAASDTWPIEHADAVLCINMIHISPFAACVGLMRGAARVLPTGGTLVTYGPYKVDGAHTAPSNAAFDDSLRARDPSWGVRDIADVASVAADNNIELNERVPMPANNFTLIWRRS